MSAEGYLQVRVYTSDALIPLEGAAIVVRDKNGKLIATRLTDSSGRINPVIIKVPDAEDSQSPGFDGQPYTVVSLQAQHPYYEQVQINQVQMFEGITTLQTVAMVPIPLYSDELDRLEEFDVPPQNL